MRPTDGWSFDTYASSRNKKQTLTILRRRNVPLSEEGFVDVVLVPSAEKSSDWFGAVFSNKGGAAEGCVVGIKRVIRNDGSTERPRYEAAILVHRDGTVVTETERRRTITLDMPPNPSEAEDAAAEAVERRDAETRASAARAELRRARTDAERDRPRTERLARVRAEESAAERARSAPGAGRGSGAGPVSDEENYELLRKAGLFILGFAVLRSMTGALLGLLVFFGPALFIMKTASPPPDEFDVKKELKRVLRGHHLPEDHPEKPKNWLQKQVNRVAASVTSEVALGIGGHQTREYDVLGIVKFVHVEVFAAEMDCYWVGAFGKWTPVSQRTKRNHD